jgi:hypothetical protein
MDGYALRQAKAMLDEFGKEFKAVLERILG